MRIPAIAAALTLSAFAVSTPARAADAPAPMPSDDVVTLADGSALHGRVTEQAPGSFVRIVSSDGRIHTIPWPQIARVDAAATPSPPKPEVNSVAPAVVVTPRADATVRDEAASERAMPSIAEPGFFLSVRTGVLVPAGRYADVSGLGLGNFGPGADVALSLGYFVTPHVGFLAGARGSYGHSGVSGCKDASSSNSDCGGYTLQVPLVVEYAFSGKTRGFFLDAGVGLFTSYNAYAHDFTVTATSPVEAKLGLGYRWGFGKSRHFGVEVYANADMGEFTHLSATTVDGDLSGDVSSDKRALHVTVDAGLAVYWGR